ncbi:hypothetical protein GQX74_000439 [Glossina fuscipes]|nr:hypothetical protein GQX74_000439 [Glossina fuscipes]
MAAKSTDIVVPVVEENCKMNDYNNTFMGALSKLRDEKEYCDFLLQVGGETIHVHRAALAISSPYFKALLKSNMKENQLGSVTFEDKDVNAVKAIIGFIYSGQITLTEENVQAIYLTSDYFQMEWLKKRCVEFLKRHLRGANCIQIRSFADKLSFKELYDCSHKYILNNFDMLIDNKELLLLSFEEVSGVCKMAGENLNTAEYYNPFTKRWSCIANMNYARKNFGICAYKDCIYVMGGCGTSLSTEIFNPSTDRWYAQTTDNTINYNFCNRIALIENSIYTLGYKFDGIITCTRFDPRDGRFYKLYNVGGENMETFEVFSSDHSLYCIQNNYFVRLDVRINKWERMPLMPRERSNFSAIMLEDNIYVFGGMTIKSNHDDSVSCYNVLDKKWTESDLIGPRVVDASAGVFSVNFDIN